MKRGAYMDNIKRRDLEMPYISDASVMEEQKACRRILQENRKHAAGSCRN